MFICYNWMPTIAEHIIDIPLEFYTNSGVSPMHSYPKFSIQGIRENDTIFVKTDYIVSGQFGNIVDKIKVPFNLITGVSSYNIGRDGGDVYKKILEYDNLIKWVCTNPPNIESEKIIPIPIGFPERERPTGDEGLLKRFHKDRKPHADKLKKAYLPFHDFSTNLSREKEFNDISKEPKVEAEKSKLSIEEYYKKMDSYQYTICLQGRGPDIHRIYESFLVGSIPVVVNNPVIYKMLDYYKLNYVRCPESSCIKESIEEHRNNDISINDNFIILENLKNRVLRNLNK